MSKRPSDPNMRDHIRHSPSVPSGIDPGWIDVGAIAPPEPVSLGQSDDAAAYPTKAVQTAQNQLTRAGVDPEVVDRPNVETLEECLAAAFVRRGRPSVAEAEALSGRILDASWDVLLTAGFESFTFDRVARHAHIGKATIYSRFPGKVELMRALLSRRIEMRSDHFKAAGSDLSIEAAFCLRAADTIKILFSPDGALLERLIDWLEQETGEGQRMRAQAYRDAIDSIGASLLNAGTLGANESNSAEQDADPARRTFAEPALAARLWLEGLIGHAKLAYTEGASSPAEIERWASDYTRFFFAGLHAMAAN